MKEELRADGEFCSVMTAAAAFEHADDNVSLRLRTPHLYEGFEGQWNENVR